MQSSTVFGLVGLTAALVLLPCCRRQEDVRAPAPTAAAVAAGTPAAAPVLEPWRAELLELAFRAASSLPVEPHRKTRCKNQELVVDAWLQLAEPQRALAAIGQIGDWRRGTAYGDHAIWLLQHGDPDGGRRSLELAREVAASQAVKADQEWRGERIDAKIAQAEALLASKPAAAPPPTPASFDAAMAAVEAAVKGGNLDSIRSALDACARLYGLFFGDAERRERAADAVRTARRRLPVTMAIEVTADLAGVASGHGDADAARALADEAQGLVDAAHWLPQDEIALLARMAKLRSRIGDADGARRQADAALARYHGQRPSIVDIDRAGALRPLGEAYQAMGQPALALSVYVLAVAAGNDNPNSRPRAEDLCATCCSMALAGAEPDAALRARMVQICDGLGSPW